MFPDKTEDDLLAALTENNFDLSETIHEVLSKSEQGEHIFVARLSLVPLQHKDKVTKKNKKSPYVNVLCQQCDYTRTKQEYNDINIKFLI